QREERLPTLDKAVDERAERSRALFDETLRDEYQNTLEGFHEAFYERLNALGDNYVAELELLTITLNKAYYREKSEAERERNHALIEDGGHLEKEKLMTSEDAHREKSDRLDEASRKGDQRQRKLDAFYADWGRKLEALRD
ncbi:unnamed protein product, partial [Amoebophrya sp. A25]